MSDTTKRKDFYTAGSYKTPGGLFCAVTLTEPCPSSGHWSRMGVAVAGKFGKRANLIGWGDLIRAVAWAAKASPAFRADLIEALNEVPHV